MQILVDTSIWIDYFRTGKNSENLDDFIEQNIIVTNDIILAELIPYLKIKNQKTLIEILNSINKIDLKIDWQEIIDLKYQFIKSGINGIGIPDLIIAQNSIKNNCKIYSLDKHFKLMKTVVNISLV